MTIKNQFKTVKENWLIAVLLIVLISVPLLSGITSISSFKFFSGDEYMTESMMASSEPAFRGGGVYYDESFAPDVTERKLTKTASISNEIERGEFRDAELKLKAIVSGTNSVLLSENVYKSGIGRKSYLNGGYQLKVETGKYDTVILQLKEIGEIQSFNENMQDVTGRYTDLNVDLQAEKARLARFKEMYQEAEKVEDKIQLSDRIFNQERTVKYLEDALDNIDKRVDYSTVSVQLYEKQSEYKNIILVKLSELVRNIVDSFNNLLGLIFWAIPYALAGIVIWFVYRKVKKK